MNDTTNNGIGPFLRARREQVRPEDVGITNLDRRRVPGLRREELAMLAGVSVDYYVRLEQGRDHRPSPQIIDALARVLQLDEDATLHLHQLASPPPRRRRRSRPERVRPGIAQLLAAWTASPALVIGRRLDVLSANAMAQALNPTWVPGANLVRTLFLDPAVRDLHVDLETVAADTVATLRGLVGPDLDDPALIDLVGELSLKSDAFRRLWARHDVRAKADGTKRFRHPAVGLLELRYETLTVNASDGQVLVAYSAAPGSASERGLALLSSMTAVSPRDGSRPLPPSARAPGRAPSDPTRDAPSR